MHVTLTTVGRLSPIFPSQNCFSIASYHHGFSTFLCNFFVREVGVPTGGEGGFGIKGQCVVFQKFLDFFSSLLGLAKIRKIPTIAANER